MLVKTKQEDPEVLEQRRRLAQSKSVQELSQLRSLSDFPVPSTLKRLVSKSNKDLSGARSGNSSIRTSLSNLSTKEGVYATLPRSLTTKEVLVKSRYEDPELQRERQALTQAKSVSELAQISSISDFPVPANISRLFSPKEKE